MRYMFMRFPNGKAKAVTLSYDDGCKDDIRFSDVISKAGLKCTFNLNSCKFPNGALSKEQVQTLFLSRGHEIAVHGEYHRAEGLIRPIEGIREVLDCRIGLEEMFGIIIRGMAYPDSGIRIIANGTSYENIKKYLTDLDIAYARTLGADNNSFELPSDWHAWMPSAHHTNPNIMELIDEFMNLDVTSVENRTRRNPKLFYLWGHSFEFERNNNWDLLDDICEKLAGKDDIWYATNIEIYEYVQAYNSLVYSADGSLVYNPTLLDIWFDVDGTLHCIKSGETKKLTNV